MVQFPFSGGSPGKKRPALVVQSDRNNQRLANTIIAMISTNLSRADSEPTQFLIDLGTPVGQQSGLVSTSVVKCENLFTIEQALVRRVIGSLPEASMAEVDQCLKASLGMA
ncbi:MAG: type II toxin-antitoxin system PemK/MazF family toxin [Anaerolineae bacterium]|nr:type II toxin-antitoxin system PemK/MazF family toxin [Anaerolineae bacterium]